MLVIEALLIALVLLLFSVGASLLILLGSETTLFGSIIGKGIGIGEGNGLGKLVALLGLTTGIGVWFILISLLVTFLFGGELIVNPIIDNNSANICNL